MAVIRTKTPTGEPIIIMSEAEFDRLVELAEDAEDLAAIERSQAAHAAGREELLTLDEVDAMRDASTPVAFWRAKRGLTSEDLARRVGVDIPLLASIERGESVGDVFLYGKLAEALRVTVEDLIPDKP